MLKQAGIYTITNLINAAVPFLLLPLLTNFLTPAEYGIVAMFQVLMNGVLPFIGFSLDGAISRQYFEKDNSDFSNYVTNSMYILVVSSIAISVLFLGSGVFVERYSEFPKEWLWSVLIFAIGQKIAEVLLSIWRVQNKALQFGFFRILRTGLDMALSIYFVIVLKRSWEGRIEGQVIAIAFFALLAIIYLYRGGFIKHGFNKTHIKSVLNFGIPLIPHVLGAIIITYSDRLFITNMIGIHEMGLYAVGYQIGMIIALIQNSFNQAWQPWLYGKIKEGNENEKIRIVKYTYLYFFLIVILALIVSLLGPFIIRLMTDSSYEGSAPFITWIAFGFAFNGMYKMVVNYLYYFRKTTVVGIITICTAGINIALNYYLISVTGAIGAAQASALSFFIQMILIWFFCAKIYPMPWFNFSSKKE